jgi:hypothetical protein
VHHDDESLGSVLWRSSATGLNRTQVVSSGETSERAKARVGCLLIEDAGRERGLYAGEVPKARLEALSRP